MKKKWRVLHTSESSQDWIYLFISFATHAYAPKIKNDKYVKKVSRG